MVSLGGRIEMRNPVVEMEGDEMAKILWDMVKGELLEPFVELKTWRFDLSLRGRDETDDGITLEAARAVLEAGVGVKCATVTPTIEEAKSLRLKRAYRSPNATIREVLDGVIVRRPIAVEGIRPLVSRWKRPIVVARHAYGDLYGAFEEILRPGDEARLTVRRADGSEEVHSLVPGKEAVISLQHNLKSSIEFFARTCFSYALEHHLNVLFAAKDTVSKVYDGTFRRTFEEVYREFEEDFKARGLSFEYRLIDDALSQLLRWEGGLLWACKNYEGDVFSDMVASAFGGLGLMTSELISPTGARLYEAAHGTVRRHYLARLRGERTSTNPVATVFAWTGALRFRGKLDGDPELISFAEGLEGAVERVLLSGIVTKDLGELFGEGARVVDTEGFLEAVRGEMGR